MFLRSVLQLLVTANFPSSLILFSLTMEAIRSSETPVLTAATRCHIPQDSILLIHKLSTINSLSISLLHFH
jgi:hypothetical protein